MIKANHNNGEVDASMKGSTEELVTEISVIIASLHQNFLKSLGL